MNKLKSKVNTHSKTKNKLLLSLLVGLTLIGNTFASNAETKADDLNYTENLKSIAPQGELSLIAKPTLYQLDLTIAPSSDGIIDIKWKLTNCFR